MTGRILYVATPAKDEYVRGLFSLSCTRAAALFARAKVGAFFVIQQGGAIAEQRNRLVARFLASGATDLLFVDDDLEWRAEDALRMLEFNEGRGAIVAGAYSWRQLPMQLMCIPEEPAQLVGEFARARRVATGFMLIPREAFARMDARLALRRYKPSPHADPSDMLERTAYFEDVVTEYGYFQTEDYTFCERWLRAGGELFVDTVARFTHVGAMGYAAASLEQQNFGAKGVKE